MSRTSHADTDWNKIRITVSTLRAGQSAEVSTSEGVLVVKKTRSRSWFIQQEGKQRGRFADRLDEVMEDIEYFVQTGALPRGGQKPPARKKAPKKRQSNPHTVGSVGRWYGDEAKILIWRAPVGPKGGRRWVIALVWENGGIAETFGNPKGYENFASAEAEAELVAKALRAGDYAKAKRVGTHEMRLTNPHSSVAPKGTKWDGEKAKQRLRRMTSDMTKAQRQKVYEAAFAMWPKRGEDRSNIDNYKLPVMDVKRGKLVLIPKAVSSAKGYLHGARDVKIQATPAQKRAAEERLKKLDRRIR